MQTATETYRSLARNAAYAHRVKDVAMATDMFTTLWRCLTAENESDHSYARQEFNATFGRAYRERWEPGLSAAPAPMPPNVSSLGLAAVSKAIRRGPTPDYRDASGRQMSNRTIADCAAFFARKVEV